MLRGDVVLLTCCFGEFFEGALRGGPLSSLSASLAMPPSRYRARGYVRRRVFVCVGCCWWDGFGGRCGETELREGWDGYGQ